MHADRTVVVRVIEGASAGDANDVPSREIGKFRTFRQLHHRSLRCRIRMPGHVPGRRGVRAHRHADVSRFGGTRMLGNFKNH
ncbi:hypothetical protein D1872_335980 [compost metagenome]